MTSQNMEIHAITAMTGNVKICWFSVNGSHRSHPQSDTFRLINKKTREEKCKITNNIIVS